MVWLRAQAGSGTYVKMRYGVALMFFCMPFALNNIIIDVSVLPLDYECVLAESSPVSR